MLDNLDNMTPDELTARLRELRAELTACHNRRKAIRGAALTGIDRSVAAAAERVQQGLRDRVRWVAVGGGDVIALDGQLAADYLLACDPGVAELWRDIIATMPAGSPSDALGPYETQEEYVAETGRLKAAINAVEHEIDRRDVAEQVAALQRRHQEVEA